MKFATAASFLASSAVTKASGSVDNTVPVDESHLTIRRKLAASLEKQLQQSGVTNELKRRRASKNENGKTIRRLKKKLDNSKLRNIVQEEEEVEKSSKTNSILDFGALSSTHKRDLQDGTTVIEDLSQLCSANITDPGFSCDCSSLDVEAYSASVSCSYAEQCLPTTVNSCGEDITFCFVESYNLEVKGPETGKSSICYDITAPTTMDFNYCYGLTYDATADDSNSYPTGCFLEIDGTECDLCELTNSEIYPNQTCNNFDCTNADADVSSGSVCDGQTIISMKIADLLTYGSLPCPGGCNICPDNGVMTNLQSKVMLPDIENFTFMNNEDDGSYYCYQLNLGGLLGYFSQMPGDLCETLPTIVNEPCGCSGEGTGASPVEAPMPIEEQTTEPSASIGSINDGGEVENNIPVEAPTPMEETVPAVPESGGSANNRYTVAAAVATATLGWFVSY